MIAVRERQRVVFAAGASIALAIEGSLAQAAWASPARAAAVSLAVLFDLVVVLPALYALLVLRPARRPWVDVVPILALATLAAGLLLGGHPEVKRLLGVVGALVEASVLVLLARRVRGAARQLRDAPGDDLLDRLGALTDPWLRVAGVELAVFYYALVGPTRARARRPSEFSYVDTSGLGGLLVALAVVIAIEAVGAHLLLRAWSVRAAWVHGVASGYALVWLAALHQAARLRPVVLSDERLWIRTSLLWSVAIPRACIASVVPLGDGALGGDAGDARSGARVLRAGLGAQPQLLLSLAAPVVAHGPLGIRRSVTRIALHVDEPARLRAALASGAAGARS